MLQKSSPKGKFQERNFFLFSDIFIYCTITNEYKGEINLGLSLVRAKEPAKENEYAIELKAIEKKK